MEDYTSYNEPRQSNRRLIIISIIVTVLILVLAWLLSWLFSHGRLSIEVNQLKIEPTITLTNIDSGKVITHTGYQYNATLPSGDYTARVVSGINISEKFITVGNLLNETRANIEVINGLLTTPVTNTPTYKPQVTDSGVRFIDTVVWMYGEFKDSSLRYYNINNATNSAWIDDSSGYISTLSLGDNLAKLNFIQNGNVTDIPLPTPTTNPISLKYNEGSLYLTIENHLYRYHDGKFDRLFEVTEQPEIVFATKESIGLLSVPAYSAEEKDYTLKISDYSGNTKHQENLGTAETFDLWSSASVSDDGSKIAIGRQGSVTVYQLSDMSELYKVPMDNISSLVWMNNDLLFATDNILWRYKPDQKLSQSITELLSYMKVTGIFTHGKDIYVVNEKIDGSSIFKVTNEPNVIAETLDGAETTFLEPGCYFNYFSLQSTAIFVHQENDDISRCIEPIQSLLRSIELNPDEIPIVKSIGNYNPY